jgi:hypothetical protein
MIEVMLCYKAVESLFEMNAAFYKTKDILTIMKSKQVFLRTFAAGILLAGAFAHATTVTGTVTNKTTGKPAAGDAVVLVDVQAGMGEVAHATTDSNGRYSLTEPGNSPYLVRVTHQGAGYFIAAPESGASANVTVYDVAQKVQGVFIEADVLEVETDHGQLKVTERYFVHNTSNPPTTQWSAKSFQLTLPPDAVIDGVEGERPNGLPTGIKMDPDGPKGHYAFNFPIQPDDGDKDTLFQISYKLPYDGKFAFKAQVTLPADNFAILLPKSMTFTPTGGDDFKSAQEDPAVQTFVLKNATPAKAIEFTISGTGSIPREQQGAPSGQQPAGMGAQDGAGADAGTGGPGSRPGGGIGNPVSGSEPLDKYKWWILGGLGILLIAAAGFFLRKPPTGPIGGGALPEGTAGAYPAFGSPGAKNSLLLNAIKEEMFALESEKINGTVAPEDYAKVKDALETVLKRALSRK